LPTARVGVLSTRRSLSVARFPVVSFEPFELSYHVPVR